MSKVIDSRTKRILVDVTHPAHVHFFRPAMGIWHSQGHEVIVAAREKDVTLELLRRYGFEYHVLSKARSGVAGLAFELLEHEARLTRLIRKKRPSVVLEIGGTFIVHAAALTRTPALVFSDTEDATLSNTISFPFATKVITPDCYQGKVGRNHVTYAGYQELAYLHPNHFRPDPAVKEELGVSAGEKYIVVRLVSWQASHDWGKQGITAGYLSQLIDRLSRYGKVFITSEAELPAEWEPYRIRLPVQRMHHVLHYASLYIGEGATMVSEAAILGTPAIFATSRRLGYLDEQETRYGLVFNIPDPAEAIDKAEMILNSEGIGQEWAAKREALLADKEDVTAFICDFVAEVAADGQSMLTIQHEETA